VSARLAQRVPRRATIAALAAVAACALGATAGAGSAAPASKHRASGSTLTLRYYSKVVGFVYRRADGTVAPQPPQTPAAGDQLEVSELAFKGTHASHAKKWSASSFTVCRFTGKGEPTCDGAAAIGGPQLVFFHTAPGSDPVALGGTGRFVGVTGGVKMTEVPNSNDSDLVVTLHLKA
jgi:hypothetical protein